MPDAEDEDYFLLRVGCCGFAGYEIDSFLFSCGCGCGWGCTWFVLMIVLMMLLFLIYWNGDISTFWLFTLVLLTLGLLVLELVDYFLDKLIVFLGLALGDITDAMLVFVIDKGCCGCGWSCWWFGLMLGVLVFIMGNCWGCPCWYCGWGCLIVIFALGLTVLLRINVLFWVFAYEILLF